MIKFLLFISLLSFAHAQGGFGIAPISRGGTGANTAAQAAINFGVGSTSSPNFVAVNIYDSGAPTRLLKFQSTSSGVLTANRTLTFNVADSNRTITLSGNPTLADWFDQSVKVAASPTFATVISSGNITVGSGLLSIQGTTGAQGIVLGGTNQTFTVSPSGSGSFKVHAAGNVNLLTLTGNTGSNVRLAASNDSSATIPLEIQAGYIGFFNGSGVEKARFAVTSGNFLLGQTADNGPSLQVAAGKSIQITATTVSGLPSASPSGQIATVTDATTTVILGLGLVVTGGGANFSPVYSDGTNWRQF